MTQDGAAGEPSQRNTSVLEMTRTADSHAYLAYDPPMTSAATGTAPVARAGVGQRIRDARRRLNMSQMALAAARGCDQSRVSRVESGRLRVDANELPDWARALGVPVEELLGP
jgi:ribosome-binding protein aMBF1 (putative translation factor)